MCWKKGRVRISYLVYYLIFLFLWILAAEVMRTIPKASRIIRVQNNRVWQDDSASALKRQQRLKRETLATKHLKLFNAGAFASRSECRIAK